MHRAVLRAVLRARSSLLPARFPAYRRGRVGSRELVRELREDAVGDAMLALDNLGNASLAAGSVAFFLGEQRLRVARGPVATSLSSISNSLSDT